MSRDIFEIMATRRSIKHFAPRPVEMEKVLQVVQAAHLAPSSGNLQNWSFIVVTDTEKIRQLYHYTLDQDAFLSAMAAVIVCGDVEYAHKLYGMRGKRLYTIQNCAAAIQNMLLAATALELGAIWIGAFDEDKVAMTFGIPNSEHRPQAIILLGYPDREAEEKNVRPITEVVFFNSFGNKVLRPHLIFYDWATEWRNAGQKLKTHAAAIQHTATAETKTAVKEKVEKTKDAFVKAKEQIRQQIDKLKREKS